jgi:hypothetical protein
MSGVDELSREELGEMSIEELADRVDPETLHDRKYKHSETDKSERPRCELCLSLNIESRVGSIHPRLRTVPAHVCSCCGHRFEEPEYREEIPAYVGKERIERYDLTPRTKERL